ncbi:uncharacterized [Tachysurus ichikawai]
MFGGKCNLDYCGAPSVHWFYGTPLLRMWAQLYTRVIRTVAENSQSLASSGKPLEVHHREQVDLPGVAFSWSMSLALPLLPLLFRPLLLSVAPLRPFVFFYCLVLPLQWRSEGVWRQTAGV